MFTRCSISKVEYRLCILRLPPSKPEVAKLRERCLASGVVLESQWKPGVSEAMLWPPDQTGNAAPPKLLTCLVEGRPVLRQAFLDALCAPGRSISTPPPLPAAASEHILATPPKGTVLLGADPRRTDLLRGETVFVLQPLDKSRRELLAAAGCKVVVLSEAGEKAYGEAKAEAIRRVSAVQLLREAANVPTASSKASSSSAGAAAGAGALGRGHPDLRSLTAQHAGAMIMVPHARLDAGADGVQLAQARAKELSKMDVPLGRENAVARCIAMCKRLGEELIET